MIKQRKAKGILFTPSQNFIILDWYPHVIGPIGTEDKRDLDYDLDVWYYPRPGILEIKGDYVYKEFPQPKEIYIYVEENEDETC